MPKKNTKHVKTLRLKKGLSNDVNVNKKTIVNNLQSVQIGVKNAKRWISLKKQMGFVTDDDLVVHLLDLADAVRQNEKIADKKVQKEKKDENDIENNKTHKSIPQKLLRSHENIGNTNDEVLTNTNDSNRNNEINPPDVDDDDDDDGGGDDITNEPVHGKHKSKIKHHRNKTKHKDKRKKKRHMKEIESNVKVITSSSNNIINNKDNNDNNNKKINLPIENVNNENNDDNDSPSIDDNIDDDNDNSWKNLSKNFAKESNSRGLRDESVIQKTDKLDLVLINNLDSKENISENLQNDNDNFIDDLSAGIVQQETQDFTKNLSLQCSVVKHVSKSTTFDVEKPVQIHNKPSEKLQSNNIENGGTKEAENSEQVLYLNRTNVETVNNENDNNKKDDDDIDDKKGRKRRKHLSRNVAQNVVAEDSAQVYKHRKRKHRHTTEHKNKKNHDVRKAPQDGMIPTDVREQSSELVTKELSSEPSVAPDQENDGNSLEPQRLAIKIKLCHDCNSRHIQGACPLKSACNIITDSLTYEEWLARHRNNAEVMQAVTSEDPMSEGYGKAVDDAFESDDEASEHKNNKHSEEKRLQIDNDERPSYARDSLPECLELKITSSEHGLGVFTKFAISVYVKFGPLCGIPIKEMDIPDDFSMRHIWELDYDNKTSYISTTNPLKSNWVRYMRPAETREERNISVIVQDGKLYLVTTQNILPGTELTYWADSKSSAWVRKNKSDKTNCGGCNLTFGHSIYYRLHCCIFHDTNYSLTIRKYHCKVCGAAVLGKDNIMKHAAELHAGRGAYQCQYCRKFFLRLNYLEMHRTYGCAQNPQRSRPLCDFCGRKFCQPQKLKVHIKRMHSDMSEVLREFQCKLCLKLLGSRAALQRHMKEVHHKDVVGAATCDRCGKMFQNKSNLKIHMLTHSGVKPFKCKEENCKAAFTTKQCLQFHYKKVHGLTEEMMPKIERSVAYTFDAYSGGIIEDGGRGKTPRLNRQDSNEDKQDEMLTEENCQNTVINDTSSQINSENIDSPDDIEIDKTIIKNTMLESESMRERSSPLPAEISPHVHITMAPNIDLPGVPNIRQETIQEICGPSRMQSKGSKKWMGEFNPPITKVTDHQHSVSSIPSVVSSTDVYDFEDTSVSKKADHERSPPLLTSSIIDDGKLNSLSVYRRTESTNASLLVEAALDAAERDIGAVSSPILEDTDRDGNLYSISHQLQSPLSNRSPDPHLESYIHQQDDLMSPVPTTPDNRNSSPTHLHSDYHLHRSIDYVNVNVNTGRTHNIEQYLHHDDQPRNNSPPPTNYIHMTQDLNNTLSTSNSRYLDLHHHHHHHQVPTENLSSDEGDSVAQNLSISVKDKALQLDLSTSYKYDSLDLEFGNRERGNFESLALNNGEMHGLDMSARGFQSFGSQIQSSRYHHHHLYEISERQTVDLSKTGAYSISSPPPYPHTDVLRVVSLDLTPGGRHSVDLSLSRSHHLHGPSGPRMITSPRPSASTTPHIVPDIAESRMVTSPPPLSSYNPAYPVSPAPYHPPRPGYHHYSGYY